MLNGCGPSSSPIAASAGILAAAAFVSSTSFFWSAVRRLAKSAANFV